MEYAARSSLSSDGRTRAFSRRQAKPYRHNRRHTVTQDGTPAPGKSNQTEDMVESSAPIQRATADTTIISRNSAAKAEAKVLSGEDP